MTVRYRSVLMAANLALLAACASPIKTTELARLDYSSGYRYSHLEDQSPKAIEKSAIVMTFSGGGTRAAALADGALRALSATAVNSKAGPVPLSSQIDLVSSVSGGSLTAAYFALKGVEGLDRLESDFLYQDIMGKLFTRVALNPFRLFYPRINILSEYLNEEIFEGATYENLTTRPADPRQRRPYVILNATDMSTGSFFSFSQDQFDLICSDLSKFKLADAVAASAAFPVVLSPLTIMNRSPCDAQRIASQTTGSRWRLSDDQQPEPVRIFNERFVEAGQGMNYPAGDNLARFRRGTVSLSYLNRSGRNKYLQLLDGGISDNLGLSLPLVLTATTSEAPAFLSWANTGVIDKMLFVVVNARGESKNDYGESARPPGVIDMLTTSVSSPIDATSFQLLSKLDLLLDYRLSPKSVVMVDFDFISDAGCRAYFQGMATSWTLSKTEVDDLISVGKAIVLQSPSYKTYVAALGAIPPEPERTVDDICRARMKSGRVGD